MKNYIKAIAKEVGFNLVGITSADAVDELHYLRQAISSERIASMRWLARNPSARCDSKSLLSDARSVICVGLKYGEEGFGPFTGFVDKRRARFARGLDYHIVVREKLGSLWRAIEQKTPDTKAKICVDTSPILEKALAARGGLGWIGKNTLLINCELGSWFVLGLIVTNLDIQPDTPVENLCDDCLSCIEACPTKALIEPKKLDARRCVSYLTIEHKGPIPHELKTLISEDLYGCDLCQEACPFTSSQMSDNTGTFPNKES